MESTTLSLSLYKSLLTTPRHVSHRFVLSQLALLGLRQTRCPPYPQWRRTLFASISPASLTTPSRLRPVCCISSSTAASFASGGGGGGGVDAGGGGGGGGGGDGKRNAVPGAGEDVSGASSDVIMLDVEGMTCGGCAASVKRILESQSQVSSASVNLTTETAIVWPISEAKVVPNWQKILGDELAKHLTTCGFNSNLRGQAGTEEGIPS